MARRLRIQYAGAVYHVLNRGDRREPIFKDDQDRERFVETLAQTCGKTDWQVHAYVLMTNHFHLVIETPEPNLVAGMKWLLGTYTTRFNRRHRISGHFFGGRYKALIVDGSGNGYLKTVCDYVHLNPARGRRLQPEQRLSSYTWSSWPDYLRAASKRPQWLRVDRLLGEHGIPKDSAAGRRELERRLEARRAAESDEDYECIRNGWFLGEEVFRKELLNQLGGKLGAEHYGVERAESVEARADRIVREELKRRRWTEQELRNRSKGDPEKVKMALRLRSETTRSVGWIAERLHLGSRNYANHLLWKAGRGSQPAPHSCQ